MFYLLNLQGIVCEEYRLLIMEYIVWNLFLLIASGFIDTVSTFVYAKQ